MKTTTKKLPRGRIEKPRVMYVSTRGAFWANPFGAGKQPVAVIPRLSAKQARAWVRLARMLSESEADLIPEFSRYLLAKVGEQTKAMMP